MTRCKPLLGCFVEITVDQEDCLQAIERAFGAIERVQELMGFHHPQSELSRINRSAHCQALDVHPWTAQVLSTAKEIHRHSHGLFNCGIGYRLVAAGLLPQHMPLPRHNIGGIEDIEFLSAELVQATRPVCLDLGGIAKGFAVDMAVKILISEGIPSGAVNAGGDLRVFGDTPRPIHIRNPRKASELLHIGSLQNAALATSSLYFANRDRQASHFINPLAKTDQDAHINARGSYSILAKECIYADALTKVLALTEQEQHPCFAQFSAQAIWIAA
ncbi:FAD:protein FMN transferase [Polynucleobacter sp. UK-Kesae-W10]|nr:FAD:protein FMN transferase [Polynucleobacter sp. UK-Kesae-W10]